MGLVNRGQGTLAVSAEVATCTTEARKVAREKLRRTYGRVSEHYTIDRLQLRDSTWTVTYSYPLESDRW